VYGRMMPLVRALSGKWRSLRKDSRGLAAIEFSLIALVLAVSLCNVADIALYLFDELEVQNATEMGAQAVAANCAYNQLPAATGCNNWTTYVTTAVHSTSLGNSVSLQNGSPTEGYYCLNSAGALQFMNATSSAKPANCSAAGESTYTPGDWVEVQTTYTYAPIFNFTVASVFNTAITSTAYMRLS